MPSGVYPIEKRKGLFTKGHKRLNTGRTLFKKGMTEDRCVNWKGDDVKYRALHHWVVRHLGSANKCEQCGKSKTTQKSIHWSNKSHKYLRNLTDWISLCVSCHKKYDREHKDFQQK
jgi:hypothetical protein